MVQTCRLPLLLPYFGVDTCCAGSLHGLMSRIILRRQPPTYMILWYITAELLLTLLYLALLRLGDIWTAYLVQLTSANCIVEPCRIPNQHKGMHSYEKVENAVMQSESQELISIWVLQLSQKRLTDGEFQQVGNSERNFWWNWLHGQQRNQAQQKAAEAAFARAQAAVEVSGMNSFGVLATASDEVHFQHSHACSALPSSATSMTSLPYNSITFCRCLGICCCPPQLAVF